MNRVIRIGTRQSELATWQATQVAELLKSFGYSSEIVFVKSEGDIDLQTPLYEMGVQGIFTRSLDIALLADRVDIVVHSMKDVPTQLPKGIQQAAVLPRASWKDILVFRDNADFLEDAVAPAKIATSSIRRRAQWLRKFPNHTMENLRGNINTRLAKVADSDWQGAIFAAAGVDRIHVRPAKSIELDWMLPAPAQGAIVVVCRQTDEYCLEACNHFNDASTALCVKAERDFLRQLMGGCSTPIAAICEVKNQTAIFRGNILSVDGKQAVSVEKQCLVTDAAELGRLAGEEVLSNGGRAILNSMTTILKTV